MKPAADRLARAASALSRLARSGYLAIALVVVPTAADSPLHVRYALVVGNAGYQGLPRLANSMNDAVAMSMTLRALGFEVVELRDATRAQLDGALSRMTEQLRGKQAVAVFYYAGHGLQLDWRNYIVPTDARLAAAADVPRQAIELGQVVEAFRQAGNRMNILILDACRDNPFDPSTSSGKGLASIDAPAGTFLAYSTAPGNVASDGDPGSGNGLYTQHLLQELRLPGARIEDVFKRVRFGVRRKSQGQQVPWEATSLEEDFYFNDGRRFTFRPEYLARVNADTQARNRARSADDGGAWQRERETEQARVAEIEKLAAASVALPAPQRVSVQEARELQLSAAQADWERVGQSQSADALYAFLEEHPGGTEFSEMAQHRLEQLEAARVRATLGRDQDPSLGYSGPRFMPGDEFEYRLVDSLTGIVQRTYRRTVTSVTPDRVELNGAEIAYTPLGATIRDDFGSYDPPFSGQPAEFQVGRRWASRTTQAARNGARFSLSMDSRIVGIERITVPAGDFQTYVVEAVQHVSDGSVQRRKLWYDPRYGVPIRSEVIQTLTKTVLRSERRELIALRALRSAP